MINRSYPKLDNPLLANLSQTPGPVFRFILYTQVCACLVVMIVTDTDYYNILYTHLKDY